MAVGVSFVELYINSHFCSSILLLLTDLVSGLCLTDRQLDTISKSFDPALPLLRNLSPEVSHFLKSLSQNIRNVKMEDTATLAVRLASLNTQSSVERFAKELAEALAVLEDDLRRVDPIGEYVRWLARASFQDILSFPEQVSMIFSPCPRLEQLHRLKGWCYDQFLSIQTRNI
jgi:hypothetical protein